MDRQNKTQTSRRVTREEEEVVHPAARAAVQGRGYDEAHAISMEEAFGLSSRRRRRQSLQRTSPRGEQGTPVAVPPPGFEDMVPAATSPSGSEAGEGVLASGRKKGREIRVKLYRMEPVRAPADLAAPLADGAKGGSWEEENRAHMPPPPEAMAPPPSPALQMESESVVMVSSSDSATATSGGEDGDVESGMTGVLPPSKKRKRGRPVSTGGHELLKKKWAAEEELSRAEKERSEEAQLMDEAPSIKANKKYPALEDIMEEMGHLSTPDNSGSDEAC